MKTGLATREPLAGSASARAGLEAPVLLPEAVHGVALRADARGARDGLRRLLRVPCEHARAWSPAQSFVRFCGFAQGISGSPRSAHIRFLFKSNLFMNTN